jgi:hypothetical protein
VELRTDGDSMFGGILRASLLDAIEDFQ